MKKIQFGYDNSKNPTGAWEGMSIDGKTHLYEADFYGFIEDKLSNNYVVAKVTEDKEYQEISKFIVRPALADIYYDLSGTIFLNMEHTNLSENIEKMVNNLGDDVSLLSDIVDKLSEYIRLSNDKPLKVLSENEIIITTSILPNVFENKNVCLKSCHLSFSEMASQYNNSYVDNDKIR